MTKKGGKGGARHDSYNTRSGGGNRKLSKVEEEALEALVRKQAKKEERRTMTKLKKRVMSSVTKKLNLKPGELDLDSSSDGSDSDSSADSDES